MKKKFELKLFHKIFIGLLLGTGFGVLLSQIGIETAGVAMLMPWLGLIGDLFLKLIKMVIVPLVFFSIISGVANLSDLKKLRNIGLKALFFFFLTAFAAITIGLVVAQIVKPGTGLVLGDLAAAVELKPLPGVQEQILNIVPANPIAALVEGSMLQIIFFSIFVGSALLMLGEKGKLLIDIIDKGAQTMFKITDVVIEFTPYGVFALMAKATAMFGLSIFGPVAKFIAADYLAQFLHIAIVYSLLLFLVGRVNPIKFYRKAFEAWMMAFSTCSSSATLPVTMKMGLEEIGLPKHNASFILPLGATINMNGTAIYFGLVVMFVSQIYGLPVGLNQQIMLVLTAALLSVGCAAVPQSGLIISIALLTSMGLPLDGIALIAGIYRIIDQAHTSTNALGDLVVGTLVASTEGDLDREMFEHGGMFAEKVVA